MAPFVYLSTTLAGLKPSDAQTALFSGCPLNVVRIYWSCLMGLKLRFNQLSSSGVGGVTVGVCICTLCEF